MELSDIDWFDVIRILDPTLLDEEIWEEVKEMREYAAQQRYRDTLN